MGPPADLLPVPQVQLHSTMAVAVQALKAVPVVQDEVCLAAEVGAGSRRPDELQQAMAMAQGKPRHDELQQAMAMAPQQYMAMAPQMAGQMAG